MSKQEHKNDLSNQQVAIIGGGSFGTAIANIVATNGYSTYLWMRDTERAKQCQASRENPEYLPGYHLHEGLHISSDLNECIKEAQLVVIAVPSKSFRDVTHQVAPYIQEEAIVLSTTKGIEANSFTFMSEILEQELSRVRVGVLSGPNFAKEIIQNQFTGSVISSKHESVRTEVQKIFSSPTFRIYSNSDPHSVELAGALKNIYAIITGMAAAMGTGANTQAMLLTRSLAEMQRFAAALGGKPLTLLGLAGVGDLILTCTSNLSRNYRLGFGVGKGESLEEVTQEIGQVVEGVNTLKVVRKKASELNIYMPLVEGLYDVLFEKHDILTVVQRLMTGEMTSDVDLQGG